MQETRTICTSLARQCTSESSSKCLSTRPVDVVIGLVRMIRLSPEVPAGP